MHKIICKILAVGVVCGAVACSKSKDTFETNEKNPRSTSKTGTWKKDQAPHFDAYANDTSLPGDSEQQDPQQRPIDPEHPRALENKNQAQVPPQKPKPIQRSRRPLGTTSPENNPSSIHPDRTTNTGAGSTGTSSRDNTVEPPKTRRWNRHQHSAAPSTTVVTIPLPEPQADIPLPPPTAQTETLKPTPNPDAAVASQTVAQTDIPETVEAEKPKETAVNQGATGSNQQMPPAPPPPEETAEDEPTSLRTIEHVTIIGGLAATGIGYDLAFQQAEIKLMDMDVKLREAALKLAKHKSGSTTASLGIAFASMFSGDFGGLVGSTKDADILRIYDTLPAHYKQFQIYGSKLQDQLRLKPENVRNLSGAPFDQQLDNIPGNVDLIIWQLATTDYAALDSSVIKETIATLLDHEAQPIVMVVPMWPVQVAVKSAEQPTVSLHLNKMLNDMQPLYCEDFQALCPHCSITEMSKLNAELLSLDGLESRLMVLDVDKFSERSRYLAYDCLHLNRNGHDELSILMLERLAHVP